MNYFKLCELYIPYSVYQVRIFDFIALVFSISQQTVAFCFHFLYVSENNFMNTCVLRHAGGSRRHGERSRIHAASAGPAQTPRHFHSECWWCWYVSHWILFSEVLVIVSKTVFEFSKCNFTSTVKPQTRIIFAQNYKNLPFVIYCVKSEYSTEFILIIDYLPLQLFYLIVFI